MATTTYLDRFLEPMTEALTPEVARGIANLRVDSETEAEVLSKARRFLARHRS